MQIRLECRWAKHLLVVHSDVLVGPKTGLKIVKTTINVTPDVSWHVFRPSFCCSVSSWGYCRARWRLTMATGVKRAIRQKATQQKLLENTRSSNQVFSVSHKKKKNFLKKKERWVNIKRTRSENKRQTVHLHGLNFNQSTEISSMSLQQSCHWQDTHEPICIALAHLNARKNTHAHVHTIWRGWCLYKQRCVDVEFAYALIPSL